MRFVVFFDFFLIFGIITFLILENVWIFWSISIQNKGNNENNGKNQKNKKIKGHASNLRFVVFIIFYFSFNILEFFELF